MRKTISCLMVLLVLATLAGPAVAGKKKKVQGTFGASLLPFPNYSSNTGTSRPGCTAGQQDVNWVGFDFTAPTAGTLRLYAEGFAGDHDIYVFDGDIALGRGDQEQVGPTMAPAEEEVIVPLKAKQKVQLVACNWAGQPDVQANYEFTATK